MAREKGRKVEFKFVAPKAKEVKLIGDFNNWDCGSILLRKTGGMEWKKELILEPGRYEYKFVVDGNWVTDPNNSDKVQNAFGTENSVLEVRK